MNSKQAIINHLQDRIKSKKSIALYYDKEIKSYTQLLDDYKTNLYEVNAQLQELHNLKNWIDNDDNLEKPS